MWKKLCATPLKVLDFCTHWLYTGAGKDFVKFKLFCAHPQKVLDFLRCCTTTGAAAPKSSEKTRPFAPIPVTHFWGPKGHWLLTLHWRPRAKNLKKSSFFYDFLKIIWKEKNPQICFFADFWFLACSTWNICKWEWFSFRTWHDFCLEDFDDDDCLQNDCQYWANSADQFHLEFKAE